MRCNRIAFPLRLLYEVLILGPRPEGLPVQFQEEDVAGLCSILDEILSGWRLDEPHGGEDNEVPAFIPVAEEGSAQD